MTRYSGLRGSDPVDGRRGYAYAAHRANAVLGGAGGARPPRLAAMVMIAAAGVLVVNG
jgi:hypothetical protein